ncbi:Protein FAR1-RELATED SEQUENCE 3 [Bienertia sinuspersici]
MGVLIYVGRQCRTFAVDSDELSWWELVDLAKKCGGYTNIESIHYHIPGQGLESGLRNVYSDAEVRETVEVALKYRLLILYVVHGVDEPELVPQLNICSETEKDLVNEGYDSSDSDSVYDPLADEGQGSDCELDDYVFDEFEADEVDGEDEFKGDILDDNYSDISDDEYITARERVIGCNKQLSDLAQQLQKEAAELGGAGSVGEGGVRRVVTDRGGSGDRGEGPVSDYESSDEDIHTPPTSDEGEKIQARRTRRGELVSDKSDFSIFQWKVGQRFATRGKFKNAVITYGILQGRNLSSVVSNKKRGQRVGVTCAEGCPFKLYASWASRRGTFVVKSVVNEHTCLRTMERNRQLKSSWVAEQFLEVFKAKPLWPAKDIMQTIRLAYKVLVKKDFAYKVKYYAHKMLHGSMKDHYQKVGRYVEALKQASLGSCLEVVTDPTQAVAPPLFQRMFVSFEGLQKGWKEGCRKVICVDACFLKALLGGQLLSAVDRDGNEQMYPIAWAVVEGENNTSWEWFFRHLQKCLELGDGADTVIVLDQHQAIISSTASVLPSAEHRHCARHIFAHWHKRYKGDEYKLLFWNIVKAYNNTDFNDAIEELEKVNLAAAEDFRSYNPQLFCRAFFRSSTRCDVVTNNMAETFNGYIIQARTKHLIYMLEDIRASLMQRLAVKKQNMEDSTSVICPRDQLKLEKNKDEAAKRWNMTGIPCCHAVAAIFFCHKKSEDYVDEALKREVYLRAYNNSIPPFIAKLKNTIKEDALKGRAHLSNFHRLREGEADQGLMFKAEPSEVGEDLEVVQVLIQEVVQVLVVQEQVQLLLCQKGHLLLLLYQVHEEAGEEAEAEEGPPKVLEFFLELMVQH